MTSLILAEQADLNKRIICTSQMVTVEGSSMGLLPGDSVSYYDLLYGMLLASGNDAANTTAIALGGSVKNFVNAMNLKAKAIGMTSTNFVTPSGLDDEEHYSTAYDMALLASYALENEVFKEASSSYSKKLFYGNPPYNRTLTNHNRLLKSYDGLIGVKTGFTKKSGRCLVTAAERDGATVVAVTLNDKNDWQDHTALLDYGFSVIEKAEFKADLSCISLKVNGAVQDTVDLYTEEVALNILPENKTKIEYKIRLPESVNAPIKENEVVGKVSYYLGENLIAVADIYSKQNNDKEKEIPFSKRFIDRFTEIFLNV